MKADIFSNGTKIKKEPIYSASHYDLESSVDSGLLRRDRAGEVGGTFYTVK